MKLLNKITNVYLYFILIIFVLVMDNSEYTNILNFKWDIYVYGSVIYIIIMLIITLLKIINKSIDIKQISLNKVYIFALIYLMVIIISTLLSPYKNYNLLIGSARMQGLIVNTIYVISFIIVSLTYKFNKNILYVLLLPSIIMGIIIIIEWIFKTNIVCGTDYCYGTIGNVDTVGLLYTMYLTIGLSLFIFSKLNKLFLSLSIIFSLLVMLIINTIGMYVTIFIMFIIMVIYKCLKNKYSRKITFIMLSIFFVILFLIIYFVNFKNGLLYELHSMLHGDIYESFGSYRIYLWKNTIMMIDKKYILLGTGIDTYYISFMKKYLSDLISRGYVSIYDSACNIYLTMIINIGICGLASFMTFVGSIINLIRTRKNEISICLLLGIISYLIQGLYNIEVVLVTPIFYILLSIYINSIKYIEK